MPLPKKAAEKGNRRALRHNLLQALFWKADAK